MNAPRCFAVSRALLATILLCAVATALAAEPPPPASAPSKEMREKMATAHEKMAACLRSDREFTDCRRQMHQSCTEMMGEQGCPMMGMGMHGMPPQRQQ